MEGSEGTERKGEEGGGTAREGEDEEADLWREAGDGRKAGDESGVPAVEVGESGEDAGGGADWRASEGEEGAGGGGARGEEVE